MFTRPIFPLPVAPGCNGSVLGFTPSFAPRPCGRRTSRWGQVIEHGPETTLYVIDLASNPALFSQCVRPRVARDVAEVEGNRPNSLEAFDFIQTEAAIVWSGSGVWLGVDAEHPALLKLAIWCKLEAESCQAIQYHGEQRMKLHRNARLSVKAPRAAGRSCRERRR